MLTPVGSNDTNWIISYQKDQSGARSRSLSWSAALRDIRSDRIQLAPAERIVHGRQRAFAKLAAQRASAMISVRPLVNAGVYDR